MAPIPKAESVTEQPSGIVLTVIPQEGNRLGRHHGQIPPMPTAQGAAIDPGTTCQHQISHMQSDIPTSS
jgi:hypothetical protein